MMDYTLIWYGRPVSGLPDGTQYRLPGLSLVGELMSLPSSPPCAVVLAVEERLPYSIPHVLSACRLAAAAGHRLFFYGNVPPPIVKSPDSIVLPEDIPQALEIIASAMRKGGGTEQHRLQPEKPKVEIKTLPKPVNGMATIAVAGSQPRMGCTTQAFALWHIAHAAGLSAAVVMPPTKAAELAALCNSVQRQGGWTIAGIPIVDSASYEFDVYIYDLGVLTEENAQKFTEADGGVLCMGGKPWELASSAAAYLLAKQQNNLLLLGTFVAAEVAGKLAELCSHPVLPALEQKDPFASPEVLPETMQFLQTALQAEHSFNLELELEGVNL